jgi:hypothetical protein
VLSVNTVHSCKPGGDSHFALSSYEPGTPVVQYQRWISYLRERKFESHVSRLIPRNKTLRLSPFRFTVSLNVVEIIHLPLLRGVASKPDDDRHFGSTL